MLHRLSDAGAHTVSSPAPHHPGPHAEHRTIARRAACQQPARTCIHALPRLVRRHLQSAGKSHRSGSDAPALAALDAALAAHTGSAGAGFLLRHRAEHRAAGAAPPRRAGRRGRSSPRSDCDAHRADGKTTCSCSAHCEAVWRHLAEHRVLAAHYLLYPNPWPKPGHLARRVHGHPAFPLLPALGGRLELRSNWQIYVEEFGVALHLREIAASVSRCPGRGHPLTPFERKYSAQRSDAGSEVPAGAVKRAPMRYPETTR
jgi:tRNA (guanine-N7-)-methyltransferase